MLKWCAAFRNDCRGNVAMMFSVSILALLGLSALALDVGRAYDQQSSLQAAVDGAVLAAVNQKANLNATASGGLTGRPAVAANFFDAASSGLYGKVTSKTFTYDAATNSVSGNVVLSMPLTLGKIWRDTFDIKVSSKSVLGASQVRSLDIVMCIDATGSMTATLLAVQTNAIGFQANLQAELTAKGLPQFDQMRTRLIYFRDYGGFGYMNLSHPGMVSGPALGDLVPIKASAFFDLPSQAIAFSNFTFATWASGGGDAPESGLECLNQAMKSSWTTIGTVLTNGKKVTDVHPVIAVFTDAGAHPPNFFNSVANPAYPASSIMPRSYSQLLKNWNDPAIINQSGKAILFYGNPDKDDDIYYGKSSGWKTVKTWPGFQNPGSLLSANTSLIS